MVAALLGALPSSSHHSHPVRALVATLDDVDRPYEQLSLSPTDANACRTNEVFTSCSSKCEPSCDLLKPVCEPSCGPPSCQCRPGFVRHNGICQPATACGKRQSSTAPFDGDMPTCAMLNIDCLPGYHCEDTPRGIKCAPDDGTVLRYYSFVLAPFDLV
ncbi:unnamed protein product [Nippostrongylus brasiliensis]|uniref:TIL domain-containing protein n=1 Tax=Nippostrongylus brasiliensis TaxID=27835 RepID=A0A0N4YDB6_NIPBR|nr:unnamed protein product [Nippostrongylus brasiliensis]